jgi:hypothetical protein
MILTKTIRNFLLIILCFALTKCYKNYIGTRKICKNNLYVEIYEINLAGVDACYLTDSINFRINVGKFDPELGNYKFRCNDDSVYIIKYNHRNKYIGDTINVTKEKKALSLTTLKKQQQV